MSLKGLLGGKGANLAEMRSVLGLPVPPGFTISTAACRVWLNQGDEDHLLGELRRALSRLEESMGKVLGDPRDPLLVSVRSGAQFSMPGMMDTVLNLGLNDQSVQGLTSQTGNPRFALDSYRRFISMYAKIVLGVEGALFEEALASILSANHCPSEAAMTPGILSDLIVVYKDIVVRATTTPFPQQPFDQLVEAVNAVFSSWEGPRATAYRQREGISHDLGTAVNVQAMVFGNKDERSGTGVGFTRNPSTGERSPFGDFLKNAQGEDVVAGNRLTQPLLAMREEFPQQHEELMEVFERLERHYRDMCDVEFTIEHDRLWILQTRVGKRTGRAAVRMAVEMTGASDLALAKDEAIERITKEHLEQILHPQLSTAHDEPVLVALGASPGAAVGQCFFSADDAVEAVNRGEQVILVRPETSPDDVHGILVAEGVLTSRGGLVSHAAVIARGWGKPAVVGAGEMSVFDHYAMFKTRRIQEGEWISIDGTTGEVFLGAVPLADPEPSKELETLLSWADDVRRGHLGVRANADSGEDAARARALGAEGIGLCRTEHMFLGEERLPIMRRMILASSPQEILAALDELQFVQRRDFKSILDAMDGLPVTIRLLDPPLHEFLPSVEDLVVKEALGSLNEEDSQLLVAARSWQETNPMLGTRGVRLGVVRPGLYEAQVRALMQAAVECLHEGGTPRIEIMIPLTVSRAELENAVGWVNSAIAAVVSPSDRERLRVKIGTMIETPRAALVASELAGVAEFFSFGTNDLTQMVFGFSRDDVEGQMMDLYVKQGLIDANPFEKLDEDGVGALVRTAVDLGRAANPTISLGVCGEHGGDPQSIAFLAAAGVDYVSCSPFRIPVARLSAAQALMRKKSTSKDQDAKSRR
jgi:pyruvate,orthophosphate dikinase